MLAASLCLRRRRFRLAISHLPIPGDRYKIGSTDPDFLLELRNETFVEYLETGCICVSSNDLLPDHGQRTKWSNESVNQQRVA